MSCLTPIKIKNKSPDIGGFAYNVVPCGKCPECRRERINSWVFRLTQQERLHDTALFVTLTYATPPLTEKRFMTLDKTHVQNFFKRLRFNTGRKGIKYYASGEYGSDTKRPHYHAIIFDATEKEIEVAWGYGYCHFGTVTPESIAYCAKYIDKPSQIPVFDGDDRLKEFSLMSKKMGANYLTDAVIRYHKDGMRNYLPLPGGFKSKLPRYYRDKIFNDFEKKVFNAKNQKRSVEQFNKDVAAAGSEQQMWLSKFQNVKQYIDNQNARNRSTRNKI